MLKLALIGGAGNIGSTLAYLAVTKNLVKSIVIFDVKQDVCSGKSLDIAQCSALLGSNVNIYGSDDYESIADADIIVVTAGLARQPGMSRDDLLLKNALIITSIGENIKKYSVKQPFIVVVTNPLDAMAWLMRKVTGYSKNMVVGMSGLLDTSRFNYFLAQAMNISPSCVSSIILGSHGDTMVPLVDYTSVAGIPLTQCIKMGMISADAIAKITQRAANGGGEIVQLLGSGSAYHAPATCIFDMLCSYVYDRKMVCTCCSLLEGEYGVNNLYVGVPVVIGRSGVEKILEITLQHDDRVALDESVEAVKSLVAKIS